jgi:hypothetical protein
MAFGEGAQAAYGVAGRQAEIEIDIGERALGLAAMALEEERTDAHHVHRLRKQFVRGRAVAARESDCSRSMTSRASGCVMTAGSMPRSRRESDQADFPSGEAPR